MPVPITDDDDDRDITPKGLVRRLNRVAQIVERANTRLERLRAPLADPPQPDLPELRAALDAVKEQAATTTKIANEILARLR